MNKKIVSIVAIIALIAVVGICLVACNADSYAKKLEKAGYSVETVTGDDAKKEADSDMDVEWVVSAAKLDGLDQVSIVKFKSTEDAESFESSMNEVAELTLGVMHVERSGKIVFCGTEQGIADAK